jgi:hypothetical protein
MSSACWKPWARWLPARVASDMKAVARAWTAVRGRRMPAMPAARTDRRIPLAPVTSGQTAGSCRCARPRSPCAAGVPAGAWRRLPGQRDATRPGKRQVRWSPDHAFGDGDMVADRPIADPCRFTRPCSRVVRSHWWKAVGVLPEQRDTLRPGRRLFRRALDRAVSSGDVVASGLITAARRCAGPRSPGSANVPAGGGRHAA